MNNKRWYILFSVLILLMVIYVFAEQLPGNRNSGGIGFNFTVTTYRGGLINWTGGNGGQQPALANNSEIMAGVLNLSITLDVANGTTNVSWYIANASDDSQKWIFITDLNVSNATGFIGYDLSTNLDFAAITRDNARTYRIRINATNLSTYNGSLYGYGGAGGTSNGNQTIRILTIKIYPNQLNRGHSNGTVIPNGYYKKADGTAVNNITQFANVTGTVRFNASIAAGNNMTSNVTWYAIKGATEVVLGSNHTIGGTDLVFDTANGSLPDGWYNITLAVTNLTNGSGIAGKNYLFNMANTRNITILNIHIDNIAPAVSVTTSDTNSVVYTRGEQTVTCEYSDPTGGAGLVSSSRQLELVKPNGDVITYTDTDALEHTFSETDTASTGTYTAKCRVTDGVGKETVAEKTFDVWARGGVSSATAAGKKAKAIEEIEGGEAAGEEVAPTGPTGAAAAGGEGAVPSGAGTTGKAGAGTTVAVIVGIVVIAGGIIYFLVKGKPGKKGQIKFSRAELMPKR